MNGKRNHFFNDIEIRLQTILFIIVFIIISLAPLNFFFSKDRGLYTRVIEPGYSERYQVKMERRFSEDRVLFRTESKDECLDFIENYDRILNPNE